MQYFVLAGSHRPHSQSSKVAQYIADYISTGLGEQSVLYDLKNNPLPLRNDWYWQPESPELETFLQQRQPTSEQMEQSDAFVLVSPEWSGMAAPAVKNFLLYVKQEMANKPCLLVSVSSGRGGRYPIAELRMSSYKNTQVCYIPQHIIVDHVKDRLNEVPVHEQNKEDIYIRERIAYSLQMLQQYAIGLQQVRKSGIPNLQNYPHGM